MNIWLILCLLLLILGFVGSFTPALPGSLLSGLGVVIYWWSTGYQQPGSLFVGVAVFLSILGLLLDWFSGAITARIGGASDKTSLMAGIAGIIGFVFLGGPVGVLIAVAGTVFLREYLRTGDIKQSRKAGFYASLGLLASTFMQVLVTFTLLVAFLLAVLL